MATDGSWVRSEPVVALCRCTRPAGEPPCLRLITQEDLLCDACRRGCAHISYDTASGRQDMPHCEVTYGPDGTQ